MINLCPKLPVQLAWGRSEGQDAAIQQYHGPGSSWPRENDACWPHVLEAEPNGFTTQPAIEASYERSANVSSHADRQHRQSLLQCPVRLESARA